MGRKRLGRTAEVRLRVHPEMLAWLDVRAKRREQARNDVLIGLIEDAMMAEPVPLPPEPDEPEAAVRES